MKTSSLTECTNNGALSAPSGRSGGIVAVATSGQVTACVNNGKVQDDVNGIFGANPGYKRMGGLAGGASADAAFTSCVNNGDTRCRGPITTVRVGRQATTRAPT